jgi:hypothetical protein
MSSCFKPAGVPENLKPNANLSSVGMVTGTTFVFDVKIN